MEIIKRLQKDFQDHRIEIIDGLEMDNEFKLYKKILVDGEELKFSYENILDSICKRNFNNSLEYDLYVLIKKEIENFLSEEVSNESG